MNHLALFLLLPAAVLAWRWSRLVSAALWLTFAVWLAYRGLAWRWPEAHAAGAFEWMRGVSVVTGGLGAWGLVERASARHVLSHRPWEAYLLAREFAGRQGVTLISLKATDAWFAPGRPDILAALLVASMAVDLTAWLIHRGAGQWGPQPFFQAVVLLAMCVIAWRKRSS
jgi:hypothetical protein